MKSHLLSTHNTKDVIKEILLFLSTKCHANLIVCKQLQNLINEYAVTRIARFKFEPLPGRPLLEQHFLLYEKYQYYFQEFQQYNQSTQITPDKPIRKIRLLQQDLVQIAVLDPVIAFWLYRNPEIFLMNVLWLFPALISHQESLQLLIAEKSNKHITEIFIIDSMKRLQTERFRHFYYCQRPPSHYHQYKCSYVYIKNFRLLYIQLNGEPKEIKIKNIQSFNKNLFKIINKPNSNIDEKVLSLELKLGNLHLVKLFDFNADDYEIECRTKAISHLSKLSFLKEKITANGWEQISDLGDITVDAKTSSCCFIL